MTKRVDGGDAVLGLMKAYLTAPAGTSVQIMMALPKPGETEQPRFTIRFGDVEAGMHAPDAERLAGILAEFGDDDRVGTLLLNLREFVRRAQLSGGRDD